MAEIECTMAYDVFGANNSLSVTRVDRYPATPAVIEQFTALCAVDPHLEQQCLFLQFDPNLQLPLFQYEHAPCTGDAPPCTGDAAFVVAAPNAPPPPNAPPAPPNAPAPPLAAPPPNAPGPPLAPPNPPPGVPNADVPPPPAAPPPPNGLGVATAGGRWGAPNPPNPPPPNAIDRLRGRRCVTDTPRDRNVQISNRNREPLRTNGRGCPVPRWAYTLT